MNKMNHVILEGNVVRTPLFKETPRGTKVCTLPIAVDRLYRDREGNRVKEVGFYDIEAWGENFTSSIAKHGVKGRGVRVVGRMKQDRWKTTDGRSMTKTFVVAERVDFKPMFERSGYSGYKASHAESSEGAYDSGYASVANSGEGSNEAVEAYQAELDNLEQAAEGIRAEQATPVVSEVEDCVF